MIAPEFSRMVDPRLLTAAPVELVASPQECAALAARFGLVAIERLTASVLLVADGERVHASGSLQASVVQACAVTGDDLPVTIAETLELVFVPATAVAAPGEEVELTAGELDEITYHGTQFDLGEAVAESLALAIDPFAEGPGAEAARVEHGLTGGAQQGPLAEALGRLLKK